MTRYEYRARRLKVAALVRAIVEYNAHFPGDPIQVDALSALTPEAWATLAACATSIERARGAIEPDAVIHAPGSDETIRAIAAALSRKAA